MPRRKKSPTNAIELKCSRRMHKRIKSKTNDDASGAVCCCRRHWLKKAIYAGKILCAANVENRRCFFPSQRLNMLLDMLGYSLRSITVSLAFHLAHSTLDCRFRSPLNRIQSKHSSAAFFFSRRCCCCCCCVFSFLSRSYAHTHTLSFHSILQRAFVG